MSSTLTWVLVANFVVWFIALRWSLWLLGRWGYWLAIGSTAAISLSLGALILQSSSQSGPYALVGPVILFLGFYHFVTVQHLTGKEVLDIQEIHFFVTDIRRKRRLNFHEWTVVIAVYTALVMLLVFGVIGIYRKVWG